ncbi:serine hydrolase [Sphingomonas sp. TDK1]|nr:serine hydrolase [Sphingomonas sp. TDK1]OAN66473.1 serine hydrolase [Sphingomonas sp. TDK1]
MEVGKRLVAVRKIRFSKVERALTVAGLGPAVLLGCAVHEHPELAAYLPAPNYGVLMPIPRAQAAPRPEVPPPVGLVNRLSDIAHNFDGVVGIAVTSVDRNWTASQGGARKLPQQSVSKLWVAMTVLDQVDQGRIRLNDPLVITRADFTLFHQPVASLVKGDQGYHSTVGEILRRALTMSDNTCNDKLLRLVGGPPAVRSFIARNALGSIRFGPGEKLLQLGTSGLTAWKPEYSMGNTFAVARAQLPRETRVAAYQRYVADPPDGAAPLAIAGALARLKRGELLSPVSTQWLIATMQASHTGKYRLRGALPPGWQLAHKTGTGQDLFGRTAGYNDVALLTAPDGRSYALAVMIGDTPRPINERQLLMQGVVRAIVAEHQLGA